MKHLFNHFLVLSLALIIGFSFSSCDNGDDPDPLDDDTSISSFVFEDINVSATISGTDIAATVAYNVDVTALVPTITIAATSSISPASGIAQDFTNPVTYTVTAENGDELVYTVTVVQEAPPVLAATAKWERTLANGGLPEWFTANNDRDLAAHGDFVYVHNNNDKIRVLSSTDGSDLKVRDTVDFIDGKENFASGNLFLINVATDDNGVIIGSNLRDGNGTNAWNVYKWDDKDAEQELLFDYVPAEDEALADNISVVGSVTGDGYVYAPGDGFFGASNNVYKFQITGGTVNTTPEIIAIDGLTELGNGNDVYPTSAASDASMILAGTGIGGIAEYASDGTLIGKIPDALNTGETAMLFAFALDVVPFELDGRKVIATTATDFTANAADAGFLYLIDYTDGWDNLTADNIIRVPFTPEGNIDANFNGTGGVDVVVNGDGTATVYAMITNFGVAAFDVSFQ